MDSDYVIDALRGIDVPGSAEGRERAMAAARRANSGRQVPSSRWHPVLPAALALVALLVALSFTPPGRAATDWVSDLVTGPNELPARAVRLSTQDLDADRLGRSYRLATGTRSAATSATEAMEAAW